MLRQRLPLILHIPHHLQWRRQSGANAPPPRFPKLLVQIRAFEGQSVCGRFTTKNYTLAKKRCLNRKYEPKSFSTEPSCFVSSQCFLKLLKRLREIPPHHYTLGVFYDSFTSSCVPRRHCSLPKSFLATPLIPLLIWHLILSYCLTAGNEKQYKVNRGRRKLQRTLQSWSFQDKPFKNLPCVCNEQALQLINRFSFIS